MTPPWVVGTLDFEARAAAQPVVEQCGAQRRRVHTVPLAVQVSVPTRTTCVLENYHWLGLLIFVGSLFGINSSYMLSQQLIKKIKKKKNSTIAVYVVLYKCMEQMWGVLTL
ncbi:hypothetical protein HanRHA438_Chr01g0015661 [Helianthus annuus]|nr:hypothetical protein HanRHA438_Chr01g0015661 [Helianthus annuus]